MRNSRDGATRLSFDPARTARSVIADLGIRNSMLYCWRKTYSEMGEKTEGAIQIVEVCCFRKRDAELGEENEILKETTAYFVKHQR